MNGDISKGFRILCLIAHVMVVVFIVIVGVVAVFNSFARKSVFGYHPSGIEYEIAPRECYK